MSNWSYWINDFSDEAVSFCTNCLFDILDFEDIEKEDVRKFDLIEKLENQESWSPSDTYQRNILRNYFNKKSDELFFFWGTKFITFDLTDVAHYYAFMKEYFNSNLMQTTQGKKAERYKNIALVRITQMQKRPCAEIENDLDDVSFIFLKFIDRGEEYFSNPSERWLNFFDFKITKNIVDKLKKFFLEKKYFPDDYFAELQKNGPATLKDLNISDLKYNEKDKELLLTYMYIYCVIFLCRYLQKTDGFREEEIDKNGCND